MTAMTVRLHPVSPLTSEEIRTTSTLIRSHHTHDARYIFKTITPPEPEKQQVMSYLDAESRGLTLPPIDRGAFVNYYIGSTGSLFEAVVNLTQSSVERHEALGARMHGSVDFEEAEEVEKIVLNDPSVHREITRRKGLMVSTMNPASSSATCFSAREGPVLYNVQYDNRSLFYRVSLSEMSIPYADPRHPYHKKTAFDLGDLGAGVTANNLQLGSRELVLQTIMTVSNYEYILAFILTQAGDLTYEVRATGILSTQYIHPDANANRGTVVHPRVLAAHHQHIFSLRIDPMIDGFNNTVMYGEAVAIPRSEANPHGTGYYETQQVVQVSGGFDLDISKNRVFKIVNNTVRNAINKEPVGYKIMVPDFQKLLADTESFHYRRVEFADHNIYVTKYRPQELYAGGQYTNQSGGGHGVRSWAARSENVENEDIVVWVQFGINHIPRIEDFPVMPCEKIQ
ncbi:Diamine oxidase [Scedosporium apiospermum]|uniref:Amine oxidase n=1 Tax=Pseudallescheria apiosperma TaxID=563466 RepID=A0A084G7J0_PSEDA|nr:Diamine oxidase [Scedosporium apiospermum]KEZ43302.1 Diamine oxidase [Scedosporium apiospermum]